MGEVDIIVSINVHEKPDYLKDQLDNIKQYLKLSYKVILNCNDFMYDSLKNDNLDVIINPEVINKKRFHGSITKGIYSNMKLVLDYNFKYFLVLSSRDFFYNEINSFDDIIKTKVNQKLDNYDVNNWHWPRFKETKLFNYIKDNKICFSSSSHEGLSFKYESCLYIVNFLDNHEEIKYDLFNHNSCVEEFSLQTICCNYSDYYNIGNGVETLPVNRCDVNKFTHKRNR